MPQEKITTMKDLIKSLGGSLRLILALITILTVFVSILFAYSDIGYELKSNCKATENNTAEIQENKAAIIERKIVDNEQLKLMHRFDKRQTVMMQQMGLTVPD